MMDSDDGRNLDDAEAAMREMLLELLDLLVVCPERCSVSIVHRGDSTNFMVMTEPEDLERLVGGSSHIARSMQVLIAAVGMKSQRRFSLTFCGNGGDSGVEFPVIPQT